MMPGEPDQSILADAMVVAALFAADPPGLGGVVLRGPPGPLRDGWLTMARALFDPGAPFRRFPPSIGDDRLLGGLDLAASLSAGMPVMMRGLLADCDGGVAIVPLAERLEISQAARFADILDNHEIRLERDGLASRWPARIGIVALDEGLTPDERPPAAILDRLAFDVDLTAASGGSAFRPDYDWATISRARSLLAQSKSVDASIVEAICTAAFSLGIQSVRAPILAIRAARAFAALEGRSRVEVADAAVAARLVLGPRATTLPHYEQSAPEKAGPESDCHPTSDDDGSDSEKADNATQFANTEITIAAIQAALPDDLLDRVLFNDRAGKAKIGRQGSSALKHSARRGRPLGSRAGSPGAGAPISLVDTLRAAAPWQNIRNTGAQPSRIRVRREDFRIRRFKQRAQATTIFVVDASGSTAFQRLAEAKGAVELLLAKAYVSRARVALIAFRGGDASVLLPPTRSLTRAKNQLSDLPGGGGTPLAAGIKAATTMAQAEAARDQTPLIVFLTDGQANIALDGRGGREAAEDDAISACQQIRQSGFAAVFIDTSSRPRTNGDRFARAMDAVYAPLPYIDAQSVLNIVDANRVART